MVRCPPHLRREVVAVFPERFYRDRKQDGLSYRGCFRTEALLQGLLPERGKVRRQYDTGQYLSVGGLEGGDLRGEVIGQILIAARIEQFEARLVESRRQTHN